MFWWHLGIFGITQLWLTIPTNVGNCIVMGTKYKFRYRNVFFFISFDELIITILHSGALFWLHYMANSVVLQSICGNTDSRQFSLEIIFEVYKLTWKFVIKTCLMSDLAVCWNRNSKPRTSLLLAHAQIDFSSVRPILLKYD